MIRIFKTVAKKEHYAKKEKESSNFIPYKCHWNKDTILTKNNALLQVIKVSGFAFETADDIELDIKKGILNSLFKNLSSGNITLYFHIIRKHSNLINSSKNENIPENNDFVNYLDYKIKKEQSSNKLYYNQLFISVLYEADKEGAAFIAYMLEKIKQKSNTSIWENSIKEMVENLYEVTNRILTTLKSYDAHLLSIKHNSLGSFCEISEFLSTIINCGDQNIVKVGKDPLDKYLPYNRLFFGKKAIESRSIKGKKYAGIVSIKEYGPKTFVGLLDGFLQFPFEFIITQSFTFTNRTIAINKMQLQQNRMIQSEDKAVSQIIEISKALDLATSGEISFGEHHFSILCIGNSLKLLENYLSMVAVELSNCGMQPVRETINMEPSYWGQLPGNIDYIVRKSIINTLNLAAFASLHNYPIGKKFGNYWGPYVSVLGTTSGTPFYFNFHVNDVGHSLIIGPTGAGKTILMNFFCAQAQKFLPRMFFFDKDRGAEIFIRSIYGVYTFINPGKKCYFNPLQLDDTGENRAFLLEWLIALITYNTDTPLTTEEMQILSQAIEGNYRLKKKDRKLSNIVPFLGIKKTGSLANKISIWYGQGSHAKIFDNTEDKINFSTARVFGFEMSNLLKDNISLSPVLLYIFHRINISLDGAKTMIVLDEAWALIDNPVFGPKIKDWLKVLRKLNTFVIFATQSVEDASKSSISDTLVQQTSTQIFLPNLKATDIYKKVFMLSQREFDLIKTTNPTSRYFLIKQGLSAVVAKLDLTGMNDIISVLSGRAESVELLDKILIKYGDNPKKWLPIFYQETSLL